MGPFNHINVLLISEEERASFVDAGVVFTTVTHTWRGESVGFDISEDDPRWERVVAIVESIKGRAGMPKKYRVQKTPMLAPTWEEHMRLFRQQLKERLTVFLKRELGTAWLEYSGQSTNELLSLEGKYRCDSLVLAFEEAIGQKAQHGGRESLTMEERIVLAVEALEREVNNGGYDQFFMNSSREFAPIIVGALRRVGCKKTATITQKAIEALGTADLQSDAIEKVICARDEKRGAKLRLCDDSYYKSAEPIAERLFEFIKANRASISL
jgi:uncharacterized protein DUF4375